MSAPFWPTVGGLADSGDRDSVIRRTKDRAASIACPALSHFCPPSTSMTGLSTARVAKLPQSADLGQHLRQEFLAAKAGIDGHDKNDIAEMEDVFDQLGRARRVEHHACLLAEVWICERTRWRGIVAEGSAWTRR